MEDVSICSADRTSVNRYSEYRLSLSYFSHVAVRAVFPK